MKVVLINPRSKNPDELQQKCFAPLNLMYLASSLIENNHQAEIIDANAFGLTDEMVVHKITETKPDLIGISLLSEIFHRTCRLIRQIKQAYPGAVIVLGGPHANAIPETILKELDSADMVLTGESENSILLLCQALENQTDFDNIPGLFFREAERIKINAPGEPIQNLDNLTQPARLLLADAYKENKYYMILVKQRPVETLLTSRGCPFHCNFCSNIAGKYRARSPENVMEEIVDRYSAGIRNFDIADANFTFDLDRAIAILDLIIEEKLNISFRFKSRTNSINEELVTKAKQAGAYLISLGMESGSQEILKRMNKKTKIEKNILACKTVMNAGIQLNTGWIIGYPGETPETVRKTTDLILSVKPTTANIGRLVPYPGTTVYEEAKADNTLMSDWSVDGNSIPWIKLPWITSCADLDKITQSAKNRVYYRPYYMMQFTKEILANFNITLARYMFQEARKSIGL